MTAPTPPGWYPDHTGQQRWWDGVAWTSSVQPTQSYGTQAQTYGLYAQPYGQPQQYGQQYGMQPAAYPQYGAASYYQRRPGATTTAAVLAFLGTTASVILGIGAGISIPSASYASMPGWSAYIVVSAIVDFTSAFLLVFGGVALLQRRRYGMALTASGCTAVILLGLSGVVLAFSTWGVTGIGLVASGVGAGLQLVLLIFPVVTLVLACSASTRSWLARTP